MAIYVIVDKDTDPLGPNEIAAGDKIQVSDGDSYVIDPSANASIEFETVGGTPASFDVVFLESNANNFEIKISSGLTPSVIVDEDVDAGNVDLKATDADSLTLNAGDNFVFGKLEGSVNGPNTIEIGDGFFTDQDWKFGNGHDSLIVGNDATFKNLDAGDGDDTITFGDRATVQDFDTKEGNDSLTFGDDLDANGLKTSSGDDTIRLGKNAQVGTVDGGNDNDTLYTETTGLNEKNVESSNVVCFGGGTLIETPSGSVPVEELSVGQLVRTADHGYQPLRWIGSMTVRAADLRQHANLRPIRIAAGALGQGLPARDLLVSRQHRILLRSAVAQRMFGSSEILVPAVHLTRAPGISMLQSTRTATYFHLLFDQHEIVFADDAPAESFYLGPQALGTLEGAALAEIERALPGRTTSHGQVALARPCPKDGRKLRWLVERHVRNGKDLVLPQSKAALRAAG